METNIEKIAKAIHRVEAAAHRKKVQLTKKSLKWLHQRRLDIEKQIEHLQSLLGSGPAVKTAKGVKGGKRAKKRIRRTPELLKAEAEKIVAFLKKNPGSNAKDVQSLGVKYGQNLGQFVEQNAGVKIKTKGKSSATTYSV